MISASKILTAGDAVTLSNLPPGLPVYFGYVDGAWANYEALRTKFPEAHVFGYTTGLEDADGIDVEKGNATYEEAIDIWLPRQKQWKPIIYIQASSAQGLIDYATYRGYPRSAYRLVTAHWDSPEGKHICGPCGLPAADGTQWIDHGTWDETELYSYFVPAIVPDTPLTVSLPKDEDMAVTLIEAEGTPVKDYDAKTVVRAGDIFMLDFATGGKRVMHTETAVGFWRELPGTIYLKRSCLELASLHTL